MTAAGLLAALAALVDAGAAERLAPGDLDDVAGMIAETCSSPLADLGEVDCARILVTLWSNETAETFALWPRGGSGCGPLQVLAVAPRRLGAWGTAPCAVLALPVEGFRWGWFVFLAKLRAADGRLKLAMRWYNGHPRYMDHYAVRAWRLYVALGRRG